LRPDSKSTARDRTTRADLDNGTEKNHGKKGQPSQNQTEKPTKENKRVSSDLRREPTYEEQQGTRRTEMKPESLDTDNIQNTIFFIKIEQDLENNEDHCPPSLI
jgi:hypothetical protein